MWATNSSVAPSLLDGLLSPLAVLAQANQPATDESSTLERIQQVNWSALTPLIDRYLMPAIGAILILLVSYFVAKLLARLASAPVRKRVDETLGRFLSKLVFYSIMVFALLGVLGMFGISVASFAAVLAAAGFAIGLAFQGSLSNFAAGILLLVFRPFKIGDTITAAGLTAKVNEIDLFSTMFDTPDNRRILVPNSTILSGSIENFSHHATRRVDVLVGVDYSADLQTTRRVLESAANSMEQYMIPGDDYGCVVVLSELASSSVNWSVRVWAKTGDYWTVKELLTAAIKTHLDQAGIGIPFPQMDVHMHQP